MGARNSLLGLLCAGAFALRAMAWKSAKAAAPAFPFDEPDYADETLARAWANARAHHDLGMAALREGRGDDALHRFQEALRASPDCADAHFGVGVTLRMAGRLDAAVASLQAAVRLDSGNAEYHNSLANLHAAQGRHRDAAESYGAAVRLRPDLIELHVNLGIARMDLAEWEQAEASFRQALGRDPGHARAHANLGIALLRQGRAPEAADSLQTAIRLAPGYALAQTNLGLALLRLGQVGEAVRRHDAALALRPDYAEAHSNRGAALLRLGRVEEALASCRTAVGLKANATTWGNLGLAFNKAKRNDEALKCFEAAVGLSPESAEAHSNLGVGFIALRRFDEAVSVLERAVALNPGYADAHSNLGNALRLRGNTATAIAGRRTRAGFEAGLAACLRAIAIDPDLAQAHHNVGAAYADALMLEEAEAAYRRAIALGSQAIETHVNLADLLLLKGDYERGWPEYEWRYPADEPLRPLPQALWKGQDPAGLRLLVLGEQGIGDELLFFAVVPELAARGATVVVECERRLVPLLRRSLSGVEVVARTDPPHPRLLSADIDFQVAEISAAAVLRPSSRDFPPLAPYLVVESDAAATLRRAYGGGEAPLVGISWWSGNEKVGAIDTVPLADWLPILAVPGIRFVNLQYGDHGAEVAAARQASGADIVVDDSVDPMVDMDRAAAQMAAMDLVITINNATAQMASVLGVPVWNMVAYVPDWRMGLDGDSSPWYHGMRLFRQPAMGAWEPVVARVAAALAGWAAPG